LYVGVIMKTRCCFTIGLTQNINLRKHLKLEYNMKSLNYIQQNFIFQAISYSIDLCLTFLI